jgi:hypothetical protein
LRKTGQFQKDGGNKQRNPNNRQGNSSSGGQSGQNSNSRSAGSRQPNQNSNSSSRNSGAGKKGIHPWVSSGPSSSQALTSHISMVSNKTEGNSNNRNKPQGQKRRNPSHQQRNNANNVRPSNQYDKAKRNNNAPTAANAPQASSGSEQKLKGNLDAFSLFCAYHLGIGPNKEYKLLNINEVARRFGQDQGVVKQALKECNMDSAALLDKDFDMALAQLDIQVAPVGIDKMELAKSIYEDFLEAPNVKRDWKKIIEEDRKENRKIFG